ncbi:MAG: hypothetical protein FWB71_07590, partial [Defluviitaleaceae bacterium]|nr:hypothetical protein [Defluviitaleaceae bacterium]
GVKVAVPHIDTPANILGLNVIDHFKFLVDTDEDKIYFADNPNPGIPDILRARRIYAVDDEKNISQKNIS